MSVNPEINISNEEFKKLLNRFKLVHIKNQYEELIDLAIKNNLSYREFLAQLLVVEDCGKKESLKNRNIKAAKFESIKTLEEFDFSFQHNINEALIKELSTCNFIDKNENILLIGQPGVGKSHIASAIGLKACEKGFRVLFTSAIELVEELYKAYTNGELRVLFKKLNKINLLIIDEFTHLKLNKEKESLFFQLISQRYEKSSLILTTNLPIGRWDEIFTSNLAATAILDRLLHHCHTISITGDSYRVKGNGGS